MRERELEHVMRDFYAQRFNLLSARRSSRPASTCRPPTRSSSTAPTSFGLAQLHQLRGRVGRSHHQAYAYLLTPPHEALSAQAKKRLEAIQMMEELGSGFFLAMHDLEIRGAGEVLGEEQTGEMQEIGFQLYTDMLKAAVSALKAGREPDLSQPLGVTTEINLHAPALLPQTLLQRRARAARALQAARERRIDRRARAAARGARRPLRPAARAGAGADRVPPAAPRRQAARRHQDRRGPGSHDAAVRQATAVRRRQADPARAEGRPHPLRRTRTACASSAPRRHSPSASRWSAISSAGSHERSARRTCARRCRPQVHVFVRDWLSANHVVLKGAHGCVSSTTGYAKHVPLTLALSRRAWASTAGRLRKLVNTHCHSDHMGGNAALRRAYGCPIAVPGRRGAADRRVGRAQRCCSTTPTSAPSDSPSMKSCSPARRYSWGDLEWRALAAPGHDMGALVFFNDEHRILISGDALWENGYGFVMPPEIDPGRAAGDARDAGDDRGARTRVASFPDTASRSPTSARRSSAHFAARRRSKPNRCAWRAMR